MSGTEVRIATVFGGEGAVGNPTGVVRVERALAPRTAQAFAAHLGLPDTVFVRPLAGGEHEVRFFSPTEELAVCYQALIAAAAVLDAPRSRLALRDRTLDVEWSGGVGWVLTPRRLLRTEGTVTAPTGDEAPILDTGRRRAYLRANEAVFAAFVLAADEALAWLHAHELSGLCLVRERADDEVDLRVFTTSLGGHEDVATGGAAAGLPEFLGHDRPLTVHQGLGPAARRGRILVRSDPHTVRVGGTCRILLTGGLAPGALDAD